MGKNILDNKYYIARMPPPSSTPIKSKLSRLSSFDYEDEPYERPLAMSSSKQIPPPLEFSCEHPVNNTEVNDTEVNDTDAKDIIANTDNQQCDKNKFIERVVKFNTIDENGNKIEETIQLKTIEDLHKIPSKHLTAQERLLLKASRWTPSQVLMAHLEDNLNTTIGRYWWRKYVSAAFWSNIATPINLAITLFTTLTTGQAATDSLLSQDVFIRISITTLILSTLNTFFRPHQQSNINMDAMNKWRQIGTKFEEIYYSECFNDLDYERRIRSYQELQKEVHSEQITQESAIQNYLTDLIYFCVSRSCLAKSEWIAEKHKTNSINAKTANANKSLIKQKIEETQNEVHIAITEPNANMINYKEDLEQMKTILEDNKKEFLELKNKYNELQGKINAFETIIISETDIDTGDVYLDNAIITKHKHP